MTVVKQIINSSLRLSGTVTVEISLWCSTSSSLRDANQTAAHTGFRAKSEGEKSCLNCSEWKTSLCIITFTLLLVCWIVGLFFSRIMQKLLDGFQQKLALGWGTGQRKTIKFCCRCRNFNLRRYVILVLANNPKWQCHYLSIIFQIIYRLVLVHRRSVDLNFRHQPHPWSYFQAALVKNTPS